MLAGFPLAAITEPSLFKDHTELPGMIVDWFVTTLIKTPGHAPADPLAAAAILNQLMMPGGAAQVTQQLKEARQRDPSMQNSEPSDGIVSAATIPSSEPPTSVYRPSTTLS
jgi:hypothetical protein